jgi:hypothetical protein
MIHCDTVQWPLLRIHFPGYPRDEDVTRWLVECDTLLARQSSFLVISTFAKHYQFSQAARRQQAIWYKKIKGQLAQYCLGMIRVTRDEPLIQRLRNPAVAKGIPFPCIVVDDLPQANHQAQQLLQQAGLL